MITEKEEEVLEAVWRSGEAKNFAIEAIRKLCVVDFAEADLQELERRGLIVRSADKVMFSREGKITAEGVIRRHRLAEVLVTSILKLKQAEMEEVACKVEHSLLPEVEEAICTLLGHPEVCPDGKPIPRGSCCQKGATGVGRVIVSLHELAPGESGKITYIKPGSHSNLQRLLSVGFHPGVHVTVQRKYPAFCVRLENTEIALDEDLARNVFVWRLGEDNSVGLNLP
ncbi:MAG: metal-dependent transcriptional regulator [Candidatus Riflebacteria bacterium]|nr:metal-dependent transcriptional regulator [Candidatus Riflebacteria bacterium]